MMDLDKETERCTELAREMWGILQASVDKNEIEATSIGAILEQLCVTYFQCWDKPMAGLKYLFLTVREKLENPDG